MPAADLSYNAKYFYGTTQFGGASGNGTIFKIGANPPNYWQLYPFLGGSDGSQPVSQLTFYNGAWWGTTSFGGNGCCEGTVFNWTPSGETPVYLFPPNEGNSVVGLTEYRTVLFGGTKKVDCGFIFSNASGYLPLHRLKTNPLNQRYDGCHVASKLLKVGTKLYGVAETGGAGNGCGTFFEFNPNTNVFRKRYDFQCGADGDTPSGDISFYNGKFYGTTQYGGGTGCGGNGCGTVYEITPTTGAIWSETFLHSLNGNSEGANPQSGVQFANGALYGTAFSGGTAGVGVIFMVQ